jgi:hypothetical protein
MPLIIWLIEEEIGIIKKHDLPATGDNMGKPMAGG